MAWLLLSRPQILSANLVFSKQHICPENIYKLGNNAEIWFNKAKAFTLIVWCGLEYGVGVDFRFDDNSNMKQTIAVGH